MKTIYNKLLFLLLMLPFCAMAQSTVDGVVVDSKTKQPIPGVNVNVQGTQSGTSTDFDGKFKLSKLKKGDKLVFSFIGYKNQTTSFDGQKTISVSLTEEANVLQDVVVQVGYGSVKKKDATGAVEVISSKDFNKGPVLSADQLLIGKASGVRITNNGGEPDSAPNIRIRGGSSFSANNSPLIVIDGIPIDNANNPAGVSNPLSLVNPNDIDSFTILKDASATAIYGARASNGVIIIVTKKGVKGKPQFNFSSSFSFGKVSKQIDMMNGDQFVSFIQKYHPNLTNSLGIDDPNTTVSDNLATPQIEGRIISNTNWQDVIYRNSVSQDHNFSIRTNLFKKIPFRASLGVNNSQGLVRTNDYKRTTASFKLTPTYFGDHLKVDINLKGLHSYKNAIDAGGVIGAALNMDPTKPIYGDSPNNRFAGYYQETKYDTATGRYLIQGQNNPLATLEQRERPETVNKVMSNLELDYKMHFLPELRAVLNLGIDYSHSFINEKYGNNALSTYQFNQSTNSSSNYVFNPGVNYSETQNYTNKLMDAYLVYTKKMNGFISRFETQAGHNYQSFVYDGTKVEYQYNPTTGIREIKPAPQYNPTNRYYNKLVLLSFFERTNLDLLNKYLFTFTVRADGSSLFNKDHRWGYFPSVGFAWKMKEENFLKESKLFSDLKLRLGWGQTGNNDIIGVAGYYPNSPYFGLGSSNGQYLPGTNTYTALAFNPSLTWETTTTINAGLDFELLNSKKLTGSIDVYNRKTTNLLAKVPALPGQALTNEFVTNVGSMTNKGLEFGLNLKVIDKENVTWSLNGNISYNIGKVDDLKGITTVQDSNSGLPIQTGNKIAYNAVGEQPYSAWVFEQVYDNTGKPLPNVFVDKNGDGSITDADRYYVAMRPNWNFGFGTSFTYKNFDLNASFRGQLGGKVYNSRTLVSGWSDKSVPVNSTSLNNVLNTEFDFVNVNGNIPYSDYFLHDATFLRCESLSLGYKFNKLIKSSTVRLYVAVNNAFIITKYKGQDPENFNAIDNNFYPRPRVISAGFNFDF